MTTLNLRNPNGYDGSPGTQYKQGILRLATNAEVLAGTATNVAVTPAQLNSVSTGANFASPPVLGFGSTTPRPVHATTIDSTSTITAGTTLTATLGNITATNGNFVKGTAGNKDVYSSLATTTTAGANSAGTVTLVGGTATISTTAVTASSKIRIYRQGVGSTGANPLGLLAIGTITASTSFVINAWSSTDATALAATDVSSIFWEIVN